MLVDVDSVVAVAYSPGFKEVVASYYNLCQLAKHELNWNLGAQPPRQEFVDGQQQWQHTNTIAGTK